MLTVWTVHDPSETRLRQPMLLLGVGGMPKLDGIFDLQDRQLAPAVDPLLRIGDWTHLDWKRRLDRLQLAFFDHHCAIGRATPVGP